MTKIFKKTFAFFIAVIMMISSFPYMALAEDTASATEGSTTAEMTNEELKAYIEAHIADASVKLPAQHSLNNVTEDFYKGVFTESSWKHPNAEKFYSKNEPAIFIKFNLNVLGDAVAVYTGKNNDIRFPITANFFTNIQNKNNNEPGFDLYIKNISLNYQSNFQFGNDWWARCQGQSILTLTPASGEQQFVSSMPDGDRKNDNVYFNSLKGNKYWANYITYKGNGNTDSYYEKLPTEFQLELVYKCRNKDTSKRYTETKKLQFDHRMYVLNMKPYKDIVDKLKTDYNAVKSDESKYTQKALNNYYKAVRDIINFDVTPYLTNVTAENHVVTAANAVKNVVENYKESFLDFTAYNSAKGQCDTIIKN